MAEKSTITNTEQLRELVFAAVSKNIGMLEIARAAGMDYHRLRRIVKYEYEATLEEAALIQSAVQFLAQRKANDLQQLASV